MTNVREGSNDGEGLAENLECEGCGLKASAVQWCFAVSS